MNAAEQLKPPATLAGQAKLALVSNIGITPAKWVKGFVLYPLFGLTSQAAQKKRDRGVFLEGKHWRYAPDKTVMYNWKEIESWYDGQV